MLTKILDKNIPEIFSHRSLVEIMLHFKVKKQGHRVFQKYEIYLTI